MLKRTTICVLFALLCLAPVSAQIPQQVAIDSIFSKWDNANSPGGALGIVKDGQLIYARGYGMANLEYDIPNSPSSVFRIASLSKQFTAACIVLLAQQGKLNLTDRLSKFFPDFPNYADKITVRHLLYHTSGIRDYLTLAELAGLGDDDFYTDEDVMNWLIRQKETNFKPGDEFLYSNSGYWLLGQIVNRVAGENLAEFARREIFAPLGMTHTHFHNNHKQIVKNRAIGYSPDGKGGFQISLTALDMIGDGGVFTTVEDLKKWDDEYYQRKILNDSFWEEMTRPGVLNDGEILDYAAGLRVSEYRGLKTISHGGAFVGYRTFMVRFPEQRFTVILLANRSDANVSRLAYKVADLFLKDQFASAKEPLSGKHPQRKIIQLKPEELNPFIGFYWNPIHSYSVKIYVKNDTLRYRRSKNLEGALLPVSRTTFIRVIGEPEATVEFDLREPRSLVLTIPGQKPVTMKAFEPVRYSPEELKKFAGNYYSEELKVVYKIAPTDTGLTLFIRGKNFGNLTPVMKDVFSNDRVGTFYFRAESGGIFREFNLAAGRVKNLKFSRRDL